MTGSPGSGSAAATTTSGNVSRSRVAGAHQRPARAEAGDEDVDAVERLGDLGAGALVVRARVRLVPVLERHEEARVALGELERVADGAVRALVARREDDLGAVEPQQAHALLGRVLRHHARERVALELRDERERDARVAARRLEQLAAGLELARGLGGLDHRLRDAVLDRAGRVLRPRASRRGGRRPSATAAAARRAGVLPTRSSREAPRLSASPAGHGREQDHGVASSRTGVSRPSSVRTSSPST